MVQECDSGYYCPYTTSYTSGQLNCTQTVSGLSYSGEPCQSGPECNIGVCLPNKTCAGMLVNETCSSTIECSPGLYCSHNFCVPLIQAGEQGCYSDENCINTAHCNYTGDPSTSTCISSLSLAPGTAISECDSINYKCQYLYCTSTSLGYFCTDDVQSSKVLPVACNSNSDCKSTYDYFIGSSYLSECVCGSNPNGTSFCTLFPGDYGYSMYIKLLSYWSNSVNITKCNSLRGMSENCVNEYYKYSAQFFYYQHYSGLFPMIMYNTECVKNTITYPYWNLQQYLANQTVYSKSLWLVIVII